MRIFSLIGMLFAAAVFCSRIVATVAAVTYDVSRTIVMVPLRLDYGAAREFVHRYVFPVFRVLGMLKPEYEASLVTDGQSHLSIHRPARCC